MFKLKIQKKQSAFSDSLKLTLIDESSLFAFQAGQFLTLILDDSSGFLFKSFSIVSAPFELPIIELAFRIADDNFSKKIIELNSGDYLFTLPAMGEMTLNQSTSTKYFFISMGSGITPFYSMIKQLFHDKTKNQIHLLQTNSSSPKSFYLKGLNKLSAEHKNFSHLNILTKENPKKRNRLNCELLMTYFANCKMIITEYEFFIGGSSNFVNCFVKCLSDKNIPETKIHIEKYDFNYIKTEVEKNYNKMKLP